MKNRRLKIMMCGLLIFTTSCINKQDKKTDAQNTTTQQETKTTQQTATAEDERRYRPFEQSFIDDLNLDIQRKNIRSEEEILRLYAPKDEFAEGRYSYNTTVRQTNDSSKELTLIEDGRMDDSVAGLKVVMVIKRTSQGLRIVSVKESYKCRKGRGSENWSAEYCK